MEQKNMSGTKRVSAVKQAPKKRARGGTKCAHCHLLTTRIVTCSVCNEAVCSSSECGGLVLCYAPTCTAFVSCARLLPLANVGARICQGLCREIYCRAHRDLIRSQCQRCFGFLCANAVAGGERLCHRCQTAPPVDKDDNNV